MADKADDRISGERVYVDWPAEVASEPDYPVLAPCEIDLACDAIVYRPEIPNDI